METIKKFDKKLQTFQRLINISSDKPKNPFEGNARKVDDLQNYWIET
jgi:hypothetical protein